MVRLLIACVFSLCGVLGAAALEQPSSKDAVVLTLSGNITVTNADGVAEFDRAMLEALDWREIETFTSFTDGPQVFAGPTLASVLDAVGVHDGMLTATAINDYAIKMPVDHAGAHDVLLAMDHNGRPMRIRDKGPIWIVYPLSEEDALKRPFDGEMVWQLNRLHADG
ncbi:molybdopterin-dependent oxidoreductase [Roseobacteraceae bacterium S113]